MASEKVIHPKSRPIQLTEDEMQDVVFSMIYHKYFHHRTPGASKMVLISKLAMCCGIEIDPGIEKTFKEMTEQDKPYAVHNKE